MVRSRARKCAEAALFSRAPDEKAIRLRQEHQFRVRCDAIPFSDLARDGNLPLRRNPPELTRRFGSRTVTTMLSSSNGLGPRGQFLPSLLPRKNDMPTFHPFVMGNGDERRESPHLLHVPHRA